MLKVEEVNKGIEVLMKMPNFRVRRFLLDCLMELSSYIIAVDAGILIRADEDANASGHGDSVSSIKKEMYQ